MSEAAFTRFDQSIYPGYVNATVDRETGDLVVTVRADPKVFDGVYICGFRADRGQHGRCTPGDENCNNYCNLAPQKGSMQDKPKPCQQVICGTQSKTTIPADQVSNFVDSLLHALGRTA